MPQDTCTGVEIWLICSDQIREGRPATIVADGGTKMQISRRCFVGTLGATAGGTGLPPYPEMESQSVYGSGYFGKWIEDEFGLPAFRYTCDQIRDPKAMTSVGPGILAPNEHIHQVGNDRVVAIASNFGHIQVRQDEGAPKFLNAHVPERHQYGGGFGYLISGAETLGTYYSGDAQSFDRVFGIGYFRKRVRGRHAEVDQVICAPFGDDPVLLSSVTITNRGDAPEDVRWIEYWGCQVFQFSFRAFIEMATGLGPRETASGLWQPFRASVQTPGRGCGTVGDEAFLRLRLDGSRGLSTYQSESCRATQSVSVEDRR